MASAAVSTPTGNLIARNAAWNFAGMALPLIVALVCIPVVVARLGAERFGVLSLAWLIVAYFGQFNFGLGRATAKFAAEDIANDAGRNLAVIVRSSLVVHAALGLLGGAVSAVTAPWLIERVFNVPAELQPQAVGMLLLLALTIPFILLSDCLRGLLEAHHRFDRIAAVQAPATAMTYLGPLLVLPWTENLVAIIVPTLLTRAVVALAYASLAFQLVPDVRQAAKVDWSLVVRMFRFGGWVTVSASVVPLLAGLDRFAIAAVVSLSAVAWYATPFEVISKLWLLSAGLLGALFPVFAGLVNRDRPALAPLYVRATTLLAAAVVPPAAAIIFAGPELLRLWVGDEFAAHGAPVVRILAFGIAVNVVAQVPFTLLQSAGQVRVPALLQIVQIPFYAGLVWWSASVYGIAGVAGAWALRAAVEAIALFRLADLCVFSSCGPMRNRLRRPAAACCALALCVPVASRLPLGMLPSLIAAVVVVAAFVAAEWNLLLSPEDRTAVLRRRRGLIERIRGVA